MNNRRRKKETRELLAINKDKDGNYSDEEIMPEDCPKLRKKITQKVLKSGFRDGAAAGSTDLNVVGAYPAKKNINGIEEFRPNHLGYRLITGPKRIQSTRLSNSFVAKYKGRHQTIADEARAKNRSNNQEMKSRMMIKKPLRASDSSKDDGPKEKEGIEKVNEMLDELHSLEREIKYMHV